MKKLNLTFKITLLFIAFLTCSFIAKTNNSLTTNTSKETQIVYTNQALIIYPAGTTKQEKAQARSCIENNLGGYVAQVTGCPNNPNAEIITFSNIRIYYSTLGFEGDDDNDGGTGQLAGYRTISTEELRAAIDPCQNILGHSINILDCSAPLDPFNIGL